MKNKLLKSKDVKIRKQKDILAGQKSLKKFLKDAKNSPRIQELLSYGEIKLKTSRSLTLEFISSSINDHKIVILPKKEYINNICLTSNGFNIPELNVDILKKLGLVEYELHYEYVKYHNVLTLEDVMDSKILQRKLKKIFLIIDAQTAQTVNPLAIPFNISWFSYQGKDLDLRIASFSNVHVFEDFKTFKEHTKFMYVSEEYSIPDDYDIFNARIKKRFLSLEYSKYTKEEFLEFLKERYIEDELDPEITMDDVLWIDDVKTKISQVFG